MKCTFVINKTCSSPPEFVFKCYRNMQLKRDVLKKRLRGVRIVL
jgi:hypothetical protein